MRILASLVESGPITVDIKMRGTNPNFRAAGFTLIEILAVLVILGVASALVVPQLGSRNDISVSAAARTVMADLMYAQSYAITNQKTVYVQFNVVGGSYSLLSAPPTGTLQYLRNPLKTTANYTQAFGGNSGLAIKNATLLSASFDGKTVLAFDQYGSPLYWDPAMNGGSGGTAAMVNGSIVIKSGTLNMTISVEAFTGALSAQ